MIRGLAFGTGSHPSTHLCLAWLDENLQRGEDVLDYGCGSGILAIAAIKLGAHRVVGVDIDPQAIEASRQNAALNQCSEAQLKFYEPSLTRTGEIDRITADVVVANILAGPLIMLAPILTRATRVGGRIALSGILPGQAEEVALAYQQGFDIQIAREKDGWALLTGTQVNQCVAQNLCMSVISFDSERNPRHSKYLEKLRNAFGSLGPGAHNHGCPCPHTYLFYMANSDAKTRYWKNASPRPST